MGLHGILVLVGCTVAQQQLASLLCAIGCSCKHVIVTAPVVLLLAVLHQEAGITELLMAPGKLADTLPGCSGTRNLSDNLSDLKAQVNSTPLQDTLVVDMLRANTNPTT